jgi:hypothetical protein
LVTLAKGGSSGSGTTTPEERHGRAQANATAQMLKETKDSLRSSHGLYRLRYASITPAVPAKLAIRTLGGGSAWATSTPPLAERMSGLWERQGALNLPSGQDLPLRLQYARILDNYNYQHTPLWDQLENPNAMPLGGAPRPQEEDRLPSLSRTRPHSGQEGPAFTRQQVESWVRHRTTLMRKHKCL